MLKILSSDNETLTVDFKKDTWYINGEKREFDIKKTGSNKYHIIANHQSINAELVHVEESTKTFTLKINGKTASFQAKSDMDILLEKMGIKNVDAGKIKEMKAPMPGKVLDIFCKEGDTVKKGDKILILEAMKMENMIKAPGEGTIKSIKITKDENVEKNHLMVVFE